MGVFSSGDHIHLRRADSDVEWLTSLPATGITAITLVVAFYIGQMRGLIYVKSQVDEMRADRDARLAEVRADRDARVAEIGHDRDARLADKDREIQNLWATVATSEAARAVSASQNEKMLEGLETTMAVVQALPTRSGSDG